MDKIKELERKIELLKEYKELLEKCVELNERSNNKIRYIPIPEPYPVYPYPYNPIAYSFTSGKATEYKVPVTTL